MSQQINLYNPAFERKRDLLTFQSVVTAWGIGFAVAVVVVVALAVRGSYLERELLRTDAAREAAQARMTELAGQLAARQPNPELAMQVKRLEQSLASRQEIMSTLQTGVIGDTRGFSAHLTAFARQSFSGLWLTGLEVAGAGQDVVLEGRATSPELVPDYLKRLNREEVMRGHAFAEMEMRRPDGSDGKPLVGAKYVEFRLSTLSQPESEQRSAK
ncbi:MAG: hypothetical protein PVH25_01765 [Burkholderiales bacterium]